MQRLAFVMMGLTLAIGLAPAGAADQTVLGKTVVVKDPQPGIDPSKRSIVVLGKELLSDDTLNGDAIANGATIEVIANGATSGSQTFTLPAGASVDGSPGWKAVGNPIIGYTYKDGNGVNGPVKAALIKKSAAGVFIVKVTVKGANGPGPQPHITLLPPAPGTNGGMRFTINSGDTYCVNLGGPAGGLVKNAPTSGTPNKTFKVATSMTSPGVETGCPVLETPTTTSTTTTTTTTSTTTTTCPPTPPASPTILKGSLVSTVGKFTYNVTLGLPGANSACNSNFPGTHACTYAELQSAAALCETVGLKDTSLMSVTSFWAIDGAQPALQQCNDDAIGGSGLNWEYGTGHTASRGQRVTLNNVNGQLGPLQSSVQCNFAGNSWVGCCQ